MTDSQNQSLEQVIACNPGAIAPADRDAHRVVAQDIFSSSTVLEIRELVNGYGFRLPLETPMLLKTAQFIANERLCCPFFTFTLVIGEQFWLELSGTPEVKTLIESDILKLISTGDFPTMEALQTIYDEATGAAGN